MTEAYSGGAQRRKMSKRQRRRYLKELSASYKSADMLKKKLNNQKEKEAAAAELELENNLDTLLS